MEVIHNISLLLQLMVFAVRKPFTQFLLVVTVFQAALVVLFLYYSLLCLSRRRNETSAESMKHCSRRWYPPGNRSAYRKVKNELCCVKRKRCQAEQDRAILHHTATCLFRFPPLHPLHHHHHHLPHTSLPSVFYASWLVSDSRNILFSRCFIRNLWHFLAVRENCSI